MKKYYIKSNKIVLEEKIIAGAFLVEDGKIIAILEDLSLMDSSIFAFDYSDKIITPGYFDTHVHGYGGYDIMDGTKEAVIEISKGIVKNGVTSFLATTLTDSVENLDKACEMVARGKEFCKGAKVQGIFLEGPFFTEKHKGAQNPLYMIKPNIELLRNWQEKSQNLISKIAIAPETYGAVDFIKKATEDGVNVALGHSDATFEEAMAAVENGANIFVHLFNGMSPLHHRNPGMVGAGLASDAFCELICDGQHLHKGAIKVVTKAKGKDRTILITDCMSAGGMPEGNYKLGDFDVVVKDGTVKLASGSLAGSILTLHGAVKNLIDWEIEDLLTAVNMASLTPAKSVGLDSTIGSINIGKCADFNVLNEDLEIEKVYIDGKLNYEKM